MGWVGHYHAERRIDPALGVIVAHPPHSLFSLFLGIFHKVFHIFSTADDDSMPKPQPTLRIFLLLCKHCNENYNPLTYDPLGYDPLAYNPLAYSLQQYDKISYGVLYMSELFRNLASYRVGTNTFFLSVFRESVMTTNNVATSSVDAFDVVSRNPYLAQVREPNYSMLGDRMAEVAELYVKCVELAHELFRAMQIRGVRMEYVASYNEIIRNPEHPEYHELKSEYLDEVAILQEWENQVTELESKYGMAIIELIRINNSH